MGNLCFDDTQSLSSRPDLHLQGPAPVPIVHLQFQQSREPNGSKRRQVVEGLAKHETNESKNQAVAQTGVRKDRADVTVYSLSHTEHEVCAALQDWRRHALDIQRIVTPIGIDEHEDFRMHVQAGQMTNPGEASRAVAALGFVDDVRPSCPGHGHCAIGRSVVGDHDAIDGCWHRGQNGGKRLLLVQGRHHHGEAATHESSTRIAAIGA